MFSCAASVRCVSSTFSVFSEWPAPFGSPATSNLHYHYRQTETGGEDEGMDDCSDNTGYCQKKKTTDVFFNSGCARKASNATLLCRVLSFPVKSLLTPPPNSDVDERGRPAAAGRSAQPVSPSARRGGGCVFSVAKASRMRAVQHGGHEQKWTTGHRQHPAGTDTVCR